MTEKENLTLKNQDKLPRLPIPSLEDSAKRYIRALEGLQDPEEHAATKAAVEEFLKGDGPRIHEKLMEYAKHRDSYIEDFWYESYLSYTDSVVLNLNPFFVLEHDPTPARGSQLPRAASLITSACGFIHDLRNGVLEPDTMRGTPMDMDQYSRLFGSARIPTEKGCRMSTSTSSRHIVVLRRGQFYFFDVIDENHQPLLSEREIIQNLKAIIEDADKTPPNLVASSAVGVLTTESRKVWSQLRKELQQKKANAECLQVVDDALFILCLDDDDTVGGKSGMDSENENLSDLCNNFLCGTYRLTNGIQTGTCTNRWYDKLQIIVCADGAAGINFEHTGVDGHTVLRFAADTYTDNLLLLARTINPVAPSLFKAKPSPYSKAAKAKAAKAAKSATNGVNGKRNSGPPPDVVLHTTPRKLEWSLSPALSLGIRFAETRLSDLICQNDCQVLEFKGFGKNWITKNGFSPDAFAQMTFQAGYYGLYGQIECTYEPAMTKGFLHGRTEAIRTVQPASVNFVKTFFSDAKASEKIKALRDACTNHTKLTKECTMGLGQDRHMYAMYCLLMQEIKESETPSGSDTPTPTLPKIFTDPGYSTLGNSILSTSNCGNPALRLFGFGPVASDGFGIGYIIKDDSISICASSKHLQTRRLLDTMAQYLNDVQKLVTHIHRQANERHGAFVDHTGNLIDSRTGAPVITIRDDSDDEEEKVPVGGENPGALTNGYSFYDSGEIDKLLVSAAAARKRATVGRTLALSEYS